MNSFCVLALCSSIGSSSYRQETLGMRLRLLHHTNCAVEKAIVSFATFDGKKSFHEAGGLLSPFGGSIQGYNGEFECYVRTLEVMR